MASSTLQRHVPVRNAPGIYKSKRAGKGWTFEVRYYDSAGKRRYEAVGPRLEQAKARLAEVTGAKLRGERVGAIGMTLIEAVEGWRHVRNVKPRTEAGYELALRVHILPRWSRVKVRDIEPVDVAAWLGGLKRQDGRPGELSGGTRRLVFDVLSVVLDYAVDRRALSTNPCRQVARGKKPRAGKLEARILSNDEQAALILAAKPWLRPIILTALLAGLRLGEICALRWSDVDFENDRLHIRRTLSAADGKTFGTPKGGREESIDLNPQLRLLLFELPSRFGGPDAPVFQTKHGARHLHPRTVMDGFALARSKALSNQPRPFRFHDLRHSCCSRLVNGGVPATWAQAYMRHANLATTLAYVHPDGAAERKAEAWAALGS